MNTRGRSLLVIALVVLAGCAAPFASPAAPQPSPAIDSPAQSPPAESPAGDVYRVTVTEVVDGDTMHVRYDDGSTDTVRLLGVDTPEVRTGTRPGEFEGIPSSEAGRQWLRDWGHKASEFAHARIAGERVQLVVDEQADRRDGYGRLLVYVYHDDGLLNRQLLQQGYARMYDSSFSKRAEFRELETWARENGVGLWGYDGATTTERPAEIDETPLAIAQVNADAAGNDHENRNDEYVVFENTGEQTLELSGWTVSDDSGHTYRFPAEFTLVPGQQVTLYTGSGTDTDAELYWDSDGAVWNNDGDTVIVRNAEGDVVLKESY